MIRGIILATLYSLLATTVISAQSYAFGAKGGLTVGTQKWDNSRRAPLYQYHGIAFIESAPEENKFAIFAQAGYHIRGSGTPIQFTKPVVLDINGKPRIVDRFSQKFIFRNVNLTVGGKKKFATSTSALWYYMLGIRGEYTISTNLEDYQQFNELYPIYPFVEGVRKFNYGATIGGGLEVPFSEFIGLVIELTASPDFSLQYYQEPSPQPFTHPITGNNINIAERRITNLSLELSVGMRFLHKIEYID